RTTASAAIVASTVARLAAESASSRLSVKASRMFCRRKNSTNQRSDRPGGGKVKNSVGEKAARTTMAIGPMMTTKARTVTAGRINVSALMVRVHRHAAAAARSG